MPLRGRWTINDRMKARSKRDGVINDGIIEGLGEKERERESGS